MAQAISTHQNQNVQLTKTFIVAFGAVLLALPIVTVITTSIVQAQFGNIAQAAAQPPVTQSNSIAGPSCNVPAEEQQANATAAAQHNGLSKTVGWATKWLPSVNQVNNNSTSTTTNTSSVVNKNNGNTDNRFSGNTATMTDNRWSGNTNSLSSTVNTTLTDNSNSNNTTVTDSYNDNSTATSNVSDNGNTTSSSNTSVVTTTVNDNDGIDIL